MDETQQLLEEYFKNLHPLVQEAITGADVAQHLQKLANTHRLHVDQWQTLETEVMLTLMGIKRFEDFEQNIRSALRLPADAAQKLAADISAGVFVPIREEMERSLSHPDAKEEEGTPIEDMTQEILRGAGAGGAPTASAAPAAQEVAPPASGAPVPAPALQKQAAPALAAPPPPPEPKPTVTRSEAPINYTPGQASSERKDVRSDPYRISPDA